MSLPLILAPVVATLIQNGLNILAGAVTAKGKDFVEQKLGVNIEEATLTSEGIQQLRQMEIDHQEFLMNSQLESDKLAYADTANARDANATIQQSESASYLAKNIPFYLDILIVGGTILLGYCIFFVNIPVGNKDLAFAAFGSLITLCGTVVNFHRGSSTGSKASGDAVRKIMDKLTGETK